MFHNYLKIALRNARKHRLYTLINILGLTVALTGALFLLLYITDELSYDHHYQHADQIYRVVTDLKFGNTEQEIATSPSALGSYLQENYPEIESFAAIRRFYWEPFKMKKEDQYIEQSDVFIASADIFEVFSYHFLQGDPALALARPNSLVMSQSMAEKYFGNNMGNIIGKMITAENDSVYQVTGLIEDVTQNSHFQPAGFIAHRKPENLLRWNNIAVYTYIRTKPGFNPEQFQKKLQVTANEKIAPALTGLLGNKENSGIQLALQPLTDIHFYSKLDYEIEANDGNMAYIYTFSIIAFFLILLASINYINLATARGLQRTKEVGIRKAFGAIRFQLVKQFLTESFLFTLLAVFCSVLLLYFLSPVFHYFSGKDFSIDLFVQPIYLFWLTGLLLILTLLSGGYPAFFLSRLRPIRALKNTVTAYGRESIVFRKMLVVLQFSISLVLIMSTLVVFAQLRYWNQQDLGFDKEQVVKVSMGRARNHSVPLKDAFLQHPHIKSICNTENSPGDIATPNFFIVEGKQEISFQQIWVDNDFLPTLDIQLAEGRNFRDNITSDYDLTLNHAGVLVNETLVKQMGWTHENALGRIIKVEAWNEEVIGVVKDFHLSSLHDVIEPLVISYSVYGNNMLIKISGDDISSTLEYIQTTWSNITGTSEVAYTFLDQHFQQQYEADEKRGNLFAIFSGIIIFIACLGLFGLATFTAEQRTKEIGIRKVMGASIRNILYLLSKDYLQLLIISIVIAIPVANYFIVDWQEDFAYKIPLQWWMFGVPGVAVLLVALFSISSKTIRVARKNPVDSLRYE